MRVAQPCVLPRLTGIGRFVNAVARNNGVADVRFAGAGVKNLWIRRRHCYRADTGTRPRQLAISDVFPFGTVCTFPNAAAHRSGVKEVLVSRDTGDGYYSPADVRPHATPFELAYQRLWRKRLCALRSSERGKKCSCNQDGKGADFHKIRG